MILCLYCTLSCLGFPRERARGGHALWSTPEGARSSAHGPNASAVRSFEAASEFSLVVAVQSDTPTDPADTGRLSSTTCRSSRTSSSPNFWLTIRDRVSPWLEAWLGAPR